jgi:Cys-tRNA(Pro) deacylase
VFDFWKALSMIAILWRVIKTLIMDDETGKPLVVLMHGNKEVSTKELARIIGAKRVEPCSPDVAQKHTGCLVGGTSPFGTRKRMPVYMEETIVTLDRISINGGKRGFLIGIHPSEAARILKPLLVRVGI